MIEEIPAEEAPEGQELRVPPERNPDPQSEGEAIAHFVGQEVVLDVRGELLYVGRLDQITEWFYVLGDADVHDVIATRTSKEVYLIEAAKYGVKKNRHEVFVKTREVVSLSLLADVVRY